MEEPYEPLKRFGPHVLLHVAGAGGMGRVQLALSGRPGMTKVCVLKRIHADLRTPEQEARFRREANVALRLSHGAIAQTFAVDEIDGELCLLQEFVHGVSVLHLLSTLRFAGARMPISIAVHVAREVARALSYAHTLSPGGIIHRDVTPDNVMLSYSGEVKLIDFGLAKPSSDASLTTFGVVVGRQIYTAPEAFSRQPVDARADIYSLGVVLWQMLTGESLDENDVVSPWPASSSLNTDVPAALDGLVAGMLASVPSERPQTAAELQVSLGDLLPAGFQGDRELAELIGHFYSVDRDRELLGTEIASAERALAQESSEGRKAAAVHPGRERRPRTAGLAIAAAALVATIGVISWSRYTPGLPAPTAAVRPPSASRPPTATPPVEVTNVVPSPAAESPRPNESAPPRQAHAVVVKRTVPPEDPAPAPARPDADALLNRAEASFDRGDLEDALASARAAGRATPSARAHLMAGRVLLSDGKPAEAEAELTEAVRLAPPEDHTALQLLERVRARLRRGAP